MSSTAVDWETTVVIGVAYRSVIVTSPSTEAWTTLIAGPATVRAMFVSSNSGGNVGIRLHKASTDFSIVLSEALDVGSSKRLMSPVVLASGESLQVKGTETAYWIATGVE
jgi:hypothetical protein